VSAVIIILLEDHCASHAHPGDLWQVFLRLMQLLPHASPVEQTLQHAAADCGSPAPLDTVGARCPRRQSHGAVNAPRQMPSRAAWAVSSYPTYAIEYCR